MKTAFSKNILWDGGRANKTRSSFFNRPPGTQSRGNLLREDCAGLAAPVEWERCTALCAERLPTRKTGAAKIIPNDFYIIWDTSCILDVSVTFAETGEKASFFDTFPKLVEILEQRWLSVPSFGPV